MQTTSLVIACTRPCASMPPSSCEKLARRMWSNFAVPNTTYQGFSEPCRKGAIGSSSGSNGWTSRSTTSDPFSNDACISTTTNEELISPALWDGIGSHARPRREFVGSMSCSRPELPIRIPVPRRTSFEDSWRCCRVIRQRRGQRSDERWRRLERRGSAFFFCTRCFFYLVAGGWAGGSAPPGGLFERGGTCEARLVGAPPRVTS